jgi:hypothetical protein
MRTAFFLFLILIFWQEQSFAQQKTYINHTEIGPMFGRVKISENNFDPRINFSFQTFNGARIDKYHAVGFLIGLDTYPNFNLIPMAFAWRGFWEKGKRSTPLRVWIWEKVLQFWKKGKSMNGVKIGMRVDFYSALPLGLEEKEKKEKMILPGVWDLKDSRLFFMKDSEISPIQITPELACLPGLVP